MKQQKLLIAALIMFLGPTVAGATPITFTSGNATPDTVFFVQGQSFTPSDQGNIGTGTAPASGDVVLINFSIDFVSTPSSFLSIYTSAPSVNDATTGAGSIAIGSHVGGGTYSFGSTILDVNTLYYAVLPSSGNIFNGTNNLYLGGRDLYPQAGSVEEGGSITYDTGFRAEFGTATVPEPGTLALLGLGLAGMSMTRRRKKA